MNTSQTYSRINITLPKSTINLLHKATEKRDRSSLIDLAVRKYFTSLSRKNIREGLINAGQAREDRDLEIVKVFSLMKDF